MLCLPVTLSRLKRPKNLCLLALISLLAACSTAPIRHVAAPVYSPAPMVVVNKQCLEQGNKIADSAASSGMSAQYLSAARYLLACIPTALPELDLQQSEAVMQVMAHITLNFIQGGDISAAKYQLLRFEQTFPQQDLFLPNYTSFRDTATAILQGTHLSAYQLTNLNISRELRAELERQQYWLSH